MNSLINRLRLLSPASVVTFALAGFFFLIFFVYPIGITLKEAFFGPDDSFTLEFVSMVFLDPLYLDGLLNALRMGLYSTALAFAISLPLALIADRFLFPGKAILTSLVLIPLILPPFVGAIGVRHLLGKEGAFNTILETIHLVDPAAPIDWLGAGGLAGVVVMNALHLYPIIFLNVTAALANLDPAMDEAAQNLGCPAWKRIVKITLPLIMPGVFAGCTIVFIWSFTELGVPLMFDYTRVTSVQIFHGLKDISGNPFPYALVTVMLASTILIYIVSKLMFGRSDFAVSGRASMAAAPKPLPSRQAIGCTAAFALVTFLAVLPHMGVILVAFSGDWYDSVLPSDIGFSNFSEALGNEVTLSSIGNSITYATLATVIAGIAGVAIAYIVVRTNIPGREALDAMAMLPLAVPGLVLAFGYLAMTREGQTFDFLVFPEAASQSNTGFLGIFGRLLGSLFSKVMDDGNPIIILVIAYAVRRLPYVVRSAAAGFQQTSVSLEEAARNLGASPWNAIRKITLPLIAANIIAGCLLAFSFAMLEVSDSLILAQQREHFPITKAIYSLFTSLGNGDRLAAALGTWAMLFLGITIVGAAILLGKKMGALFRL
jgi:iron(III) transport system permease protein